MGSLFTSPIAKYREGMLLSVECQTKRGKQRNFILMVAAFCGLAKFRVKFDNFTRDKYKINDCSTYCLYVENLLFSPAADLKGKTAKFHIDGGGIPELLA